MEGGGEVLQIVRVIAKIQGDIFITLSQIFQYFNEKFSIKENIMAKINPLEAKTD